MAKKDQIYLPSLTKSVPGKVTWIPLTTKLEKHNIEFLKEHGYPVEQSVNQCTYKTIPEEKFTNTKLYLYMFFQDICRGSFFNSFRYPYYLVFLKDIYNKTLNNKQLQIYKEFDKIYEHFKQPDFKNKIIIDFDFSQITNNNFILSLSKELTPAISQEEFNKIKEDISSKQKEFNKLTEEEKNSIKKQNAEALGNILKNAIEKSKNKLKT